RLSRRHGPVAFVRRGTRDTLLDEVKYGVAELLEAEPETLNSSLPDLLLRASEHAGDIPLVVLVDTARGRETRVARDDGDVLSQMAGIAKAIGIFVGVALDDDISGADGPNSPIAASYGIDYLDQEHLYKIVDSHIFSKYQQKLPVLKDIYEYYREVLPGFRWSEQRFSSLYPLHPATLEIAPLIRLYIHEFALLSFASEAGERILGRPANSLIGLDEVFDAVESKMRDVPALKETFEAFDKLNKDIVSKVPVQFRLPAKLVLKGLLTLSLNGQGSTPSEIAAAMMIFDEDASRSSTVDVANVLESFADYLPDTIEKFDRGDAESKYCFKFASVGDVNDVLAEAMETVSDDVVWDLLLRQTSEKFSDVELRGDFGAYPTTCVVEWRGSIRRGEIVWNADEAANNLDNSAGFDWLLFFEKDGTNNAGDTILHSAQSAVWRPAELKPDEKDTIRRHHLLQTNEEVRDRFGDGLNTASHVNSIAVEKIWQRVFLQEAVLVADGTEFQFSEEARSSHSLAQLFTIMLEPLFEKRYPSHPTFSQTLGVKEASNLISSFFSGSSTNTAEAQALAETYALPLGLANRNGNFVQPLATEVLAELPVVKLVYGGPTSEIEGSIPVAEIALRLEEAPLGLTREACHLILAAMVAQRQLEFVTTTGNRINYRSLDLQIIWDDIIAVAAPLNETVPVERLLLWARLVTGNANIRSLDRAEDLIAIEASLVVWLGSWKQDRVLDDFDALPDEYLNAAIWKTAANIKKTFGAMASIVNDLAKKAISADICVRSIAELFIDQESEFKKNESDLRVLRDFTYGVSRRAEILSYLSLSEITRDKTTENARYALLERISTGSVVETNLTLEQIELLWNNFRENYSEFYIEKHDAAMTTASGDRFKGLLRSDRWSSFEGLSENPWFDRRYVSAARTLIREIRQLNCDSNPRLQLESKPYCSCSFKLSEFERHSRLLDQLETVVSAGVDAISSKITSEKKNIMASAGPELVSGSFETTLSTIGKRDGGLALPGQDVRALQIVAERLSVGKTMPESDKLQYSTDLDDLLPGGFN
ncbi:MAG: hypothetical protein ABJB40_05225, partial [Acidobacteriota bacterium]